MTPDAAALGLPASRPRPRRKRAPWRKLALVWILLAPSVVIFLLYRILPLIWNVALSFEQHSLFGASKWIGLAHYRELLEDEAFWAAFRNTLIYLVSARSASSSR